VRASGEVNLDYTSALKTAWPENGPVQPSTRSVLVCSSNREVVLVATSSTLIMELHQERERSARALRAKSRCMESTKAFQKVSTRILTLNRISEQCVMYNTTSHLLESSLRTIRLLSATSQFHDKTSIRRTTGASPKRIALEIQHTI
jgi:hypothetical protein